MAAFAATAFGVDINTWRARAGETTGAPDAAINDDQLKALWDNTWHELNSTEKAQISDNDSVNFHYQIIGYTWDYVMLRFKYSQISGGFDGRWEAYADGYSSYGCSIWVWDPVNTDFINLDYGPTGICTTPRDIFVPARCWVWDDEFDAYIRMILIEGRTTAGNRDLYSDVVDLEY